MTIDDDPEDEETQNDDTQINDTLNAAEINDGPEDAATETAASPFIAASAIAPTPEALSAIFADVTRQLIPRTDDEMNGTKAQTDDEMNGTKARTEDTMSGTRPLAQDIATLARMDAHVRAILASADPMLYALNTAVGHRIPRVSPPPLTDEVMIAEIEAMYAYYHADTSSSEDESLYPHSGHVPPDRRSPPRTQPYVTTSTPHSDLDIRFEVISQTREESKMTPSEPLHNRETVLG
jgi:hypothetical protein